MAEILARLAAERGPEQLMLAADQQSMSRSELDRRVNQWIDVLRGHGLRAGDRVALITGNRLVSFEVLLACLHSGLVAVPVSWRLTAGEIAYVLADSGSRAVVTEPVYARRVAAAVRSADLGLALATVSGAEPQAGLVPAESLLATAAASEPGDQRSGSVMLYTSATTGQPKGVLTSLFRLGSEVATIERTAAALSGQFGLPEQGRSLLAGPWYHAAQLFFSLFPLLRGCGLVLRQRFDAAAVLADFDREQIALCHLVPTQFIRFLALDERSRAAFRGDSLQRIWHGGAACPVDVKRQMITWWGPVLFEYYAATEAGIITTIDSAEWLARPGSVGQPAGRTEVLILDEEGAPGPVGVPGYVYVRRPPELDFQYHNAPGKTAASHCAPGMFTIGDLGRVDSDGYLYLTGRSLDTIISGGVNIYPAEVEAALVSHQAVRDAAVFGVPDAEFGERVMAVVELDPRAGLAGDDVPAELDRHCRLQLADYKRPRIYQVIRRMPRQPTGKLDKRVLRDPYWSR
jgi:acyl-CoA synthetase (AMP-forming)/AMP-acid ligase II